MEHNMGYELMELGKMFLNHMAKEYRDPDNKLNQYELLDELTDPTCRLAVILAAGEIDHAWCNEDVQDGISECITTW